MNIAGSSGCNLLLSAAPCSRTVCPAANAASWKRRARVSLVEDAEAAPASLGRNRRLLCASRPQLRRQLPASPSIRSELLRWRVHANGGSGRQGGDSQMDPGQVARMRGEVVSTFRVARIFFYVAFIASASIGGLIALTRVIGSLAGGASASEPLTDTLQGLAIDVGALVLFALLYRSESRAQNALVERIKREEELSILRVENEGGRVVSMASLRGARRVVIISGPPAHVEESLRFARPFLPDLVERGVLVVPLVTAAGSAAVATAAKPANEPLPAYQPEFGFPDPPESSSDLTGSGKASDDLEKQFKVSPVYTTQWLKWMDEQMAMAKVEKGTPVWMSLRLDGRVRGSGVGYPPWRRFVASLAPLQGMWKGGFDGFDGPV